MKKLLVEEIGRIKSIMGIVTESSNNITLPMKISGGYKVPSNAPMKGDALHSFDKRKMDGFGGYMLRGSPPSKWSSSITFDQGKSINQALQEVWKSGINPDITKLEIQVDSKNLSVKWVATIDESKDGKAYVGMSTVGSAGGNADSRAQGQVDKMKKFVKGAQDHTLVLDFNNPSGIKIRQFFYKWTKPDEFPSHKGGNKIPSQIISKRPENKNKDISTWEPGEYKIKDDESWTYRLTDKKEWEAKKEGGEYKKLKTVLSPNEYDSASVVLSKDAEKVT
jgi:hypothetical protein